MNRFSKIQVKRFRNLLSLCSFLQKKGLITGYSIIDFNKLEVFLTPKNTFRLLPLVGKSKMKKRLVKGRYVDATQIVVSTPEGLMTLMKAREEQIPAMELFRWE